MKTARQKCDPEKMKAFDCSRLSADFTKLSKPAKRALINAGIHSPRDLARQSADEIAKLHGIGPSAMPVLRAVLRKQKLKFQTAR